MKMESKLDQFAQNVNRFYRDNRGQGPLGAIIGVTVALVLALAVLLPVTQDLVSSANLTGAAATVAGILPLMVVVGGLLLIIGIFVTRR
jgi:hypothetical protein